MDDLQSTLRTLIGGDFVCPVSHRAEYDYLDDPARRDEVDGWLSKIGLRLGRVGDDGAYFAANDRMDTQAQARVRDDFRRFRDKHGPAVRLLDLIRQSMGAYVALEPGEIIAFSDISKAVTSSTALVRQLEDVTRLGVIHGAKSSHTYPERIRRLLEHLEREGYLRKSSPHLETYVVTGKINYLYQLLQFLEELAPQVKGDIDDMPEQAELSS